MFLRELAFDWPIFSDLMEYSNHIQEFTELSVSGSTSGCTQFMDTYFYFIYWWQQKIYIAQIRTTETLFTNYRINKEMYYRRLKKILNR